MISRVALLLVGSTVAAWSTFAVLRVAQVRADANDGAGRCVAEATFDGIVNAGMAEYVSSAVTETERRGCEALLVRIDTPGGMLDETRRIVQALLGAKVPVITYVAPSGARAGSAGVFITMAGTIAAMAPGTNIGAAHPVAGSGQDVEKAAGKHMAQKVENDTAAFARTIAEERGRNAAWAEKAVRESVSVTAEEAVEKHVVDLIAPSARALLSAVDGKQVDQGGRTVRLATAGARIELVSMTIKERALTVLGHPTLAYVLLMIGALGIMIEVYHPGFIAPGVLGGLALLLAAIGLNALPVNIGAVLLVLVAIGLFVAEAFTPSFGLLTASGIVSLLIGGALLIDTNNPDFFAEPSVRVSWGVVLPLVFVVAGAAALLGWHASRNQRRASPTGREGLVGARGKALTEIGPEGGSVMVHGERWSAVARDTLAAGEYIRVVSSDGLLLVVERADKGVIQ